MIGWRRTVQRGGVFVLLRCVLRASGIGLLLGASALENVRDGVIPLVTGVLIDDVVGKARHGQRNAPGLRIRGRILDCEPVVDLVGGDARKALDGAQRLARRWE